MKAKKKYFYITLYGHRADIHNRFIKSNSFNFEAVIRKIKKLIKTGHKDEIILNVDIYVSNSKYKSNYYRLNELLKIAKKFGIRKVQLNLLNPSEKKLIASLDEVATFLSKRRYVFLFDMLVKIKGLPYCLIPEPEGVISKSDNPQNFVKLEKCKNCRYYHQCDGILKGFIDNLDENKIKPKTLPKEVMVEVTPRCNFYCKFCFNRASFAKNKHGGKEFSENYLKKIIDSVKNADIPVIRFTGGEPLLRKDIFGLIEYARKKGLEVRLNTNCFLIKNRKTAYWLAKNLDYVLTSMHTWYASEEDKITGVAGSFEHKLKVMKWLKQGGLKTLRVSTIATWDNIHNLRKFYKILVDIGADKWAVNRIIPLPGQKDNFSRSQLKALAVKLSEIRKEIVKKNIPLKAHIVNGAPLCADDPILMNAVCSGARSVDGHERFAIDPRGFAKPIYYLEKNIGDPLNPLKCWNHPFMKKLRNYKILPEECQSCFLLEKCKGGNRFCAYIVNGKYNSPDPLMEPSNIKYFRQ